jgi:hypothetical protein
VDDARPDVRPDVDSVEGAGEVRFWRKVSGRPGAEGAPFEGWGPEGEREVLVIWEGWV